MKSMVLFFSVLLSLSSFACTCNTSESMLIHSISSFQQIERKLVKIENIVQKFNTLYALPNTLRDLATSDERLSCMFQCSWKGTRLIADVSYVKEGKLCSAIVVKPARFEDLIRLKNIICD